jgi:hypothetical protein
MHHLLRLSSNLARLVKMLSGGMRFMYKNHVVAYYRCHRGGNKGQPHRKTRSVNSFDKRYLKRGNEIQIV